MIDIDHAFSLPSNKTYISPSTQPINNIAYYQHININGHQWVIKIDQQNLSHIFTTSTTDHSLPQQFWLINNQGQTLININDNNYPSTSNEKNIKTEDYLLWQQIQNHNHQQITKNNLIYTYSPLFIPISLKEKLDLKYGNLSPWVLVSKIKIIHKSSVFGYLQQPLNSHITIFFVFLSRLV
ncbi:hypothetical protein UB38_04700 [Photobacterium iliopiscarium]|nr:hypothetical protein UB38_04700 [Photobacterium iliopiscarium]